MSTLIKNNTKRNNKLIKYYTTMTSDTAAVIENKATPLNHIKEQWDHFNNSETLLLFQREQVLINNPSAA